MTITELRLLLLLWAACARGLGEHLGYPKAAAFVQGRGYSKEDEWTPELRLIESALCRLRCDSEPDYRLLTAHYLHGHRPIAALAAQFKLSRHGYLNRVEAIEQNLLMQIKNLTTAA